MYFPKSQIETNLYSNAELIVLATGVPYVGFYWSTSTGKYFAGKNPDSISSVIELTQYSENAASNIAKFEPEPEEKPYYNFTLRTSSYLNSRGITKMVAPSMPKSIPPKPTLEDYEIGEFSRYLCRKVNEPIFIEISLKEYLKLKDKDKSISFDLYKPFILTWAISGDKEKVAIENESKVFYKETREGFTGLSLYLRKNYTQFYGLYTPGGEFLLPNGKDYVGLYHIHPNKGPMVGRVHVPTQHDLLTPINQETSLLDLSPSTDTQQSNIYEGTNVTSTPSSTSTSPGSSPNITTPGY